MTPANTPWPGFNELGSLIIPLKWSDVPFTKKSVHIGRERFEPKDELHVTVIGKKAGIVIQEKISQDPRIESTLQQDFEGIDWGFNWGDEVHVLSREKETPNEGAIILEKTLVAPLRMPGIAIFYDCLKSRDLIAGDTPVPPAHITLYTQNCQIGIGVPDDNTLRDMTERTLRTDDL